MGEPLLGDTIEASRVEVAGEIIDEYTGKRWAVPVDNCDDLGDRVAPNPMAMPPGKEDPRFVYVWIRENQWNEYQAINSVRVTTKEFSGEGAKLMNDEYGTPTTSFVEYEGAILVKMPKFVAERRWAEQDSDAKLAMQDILKPRRKTRADGTRGTVEEGQETSVSTVTLDEPRARRGGQGRS